MSARVAAFRHALVRASDHVPLMWGMSALDHLSRVVPVAHLTTAFRTAEVLGVAPDARAAFCRRMWSGNKAAELVRQRLRRAPELVTTMLVHSNSAALDAAVAAGRGVILASVHLGPVQVAATWVWRRHPDTLFLVREPGVLPRGATALSIDEGTDRGAALLEARRHLRRGGVVYMAPDGISGALDVALPVRGGTVLMSRGAAALARLSGSPTLAIAAAWRARKDVAMDLLIEPLATPEVPPGDAWDHAWLAAYLACVDAWSGSLAPENLRIFGGLYERWARVPSNRSSAGFGATPPSGRDDRA